MDEGGGGGGGDGYGEGDGVVMGMIAGEGKWDCLPLDEGKDVFLWYIFGRWDWRHTNL